MKFVIKDLVNVTKYAGNCGLVTFIKESFTENCIYFFSVVSATQSFVDKDFTEIRTVPINNLVILSYTLYSIPAIGKFKLYFRSTTFSEKFL